MKHDDYIGIIFNGIVKRGETIHYELVTNETFRSIGSLAENFCNIAIINNVICVENLAQLEKRLVKNTENNITVASKIPFLGYLFIVFFLLILNLNPFFNLLFFISNTLYLYPFFF